MVARLYANKRKLILFSIFTFPLYFLFIGMLRWLWKIEGNFDSFEKFCTFPKWNLMSLVKIFSIYLVRFEMNDLLGSLNHVTSKCFNEILICSNDVLTKNDILAMYWLYLGKEFDQWVYCITTWTGKLQTQLNKAS